MSYKTGFYEGRLGIGLSSTMGMGDGNPRYPLDINGDIRLTGSIVNGSGQVLSLVPQESLWTIGNSNLSYTGGNVGIGTASPESMLHLKSSGDVILRLEADSDNSGESDNPMIFMSQDGAHNNQYFKIGMNGDAGAAFTGALQNAAYLSSNDYLQFAVQGEAVMTIKYQNKNVGIGTTSPETLLHIHKTTLGQNTGGSEVAGNKVRLKITGSADHASPGIELYEDNSNETHSGAVLKYDGEGNKFKINVFGSGTERECISIPRSTGNVGIGTTDPGIHRLRVMGTTSSPMFGQVLKVSSNGSCWLELEANAGGSVEQWGISCSSDAGDLNFYKRTGTDSAGYRLTIKGNGNVGIGTTSPDAKLEVSGDLNIAATSDGWNTSVGKGLYLRFYDGFDTGYIQCIDRSNNDTQYKLKYMASEHEFSTRASGETSDPIRMVIAGTGNVGIGTTDPGSYKLNVNGNISVNGTGSFTGSNDAINTSTSVGVHLGVHAGLYGHLQIVSSTDNGGWIDFIKSNSGNTDLQGRIRYGPTTGNSEEGMIFYTDSAERLRIKNNGNVGIGTTSPAQLLDVNGQGWCRTLTCGSYGSFSGIDGGDGVKLQIGNSGYNSTFGIEFSGYTNGWRGGNQALAKILCKSNDSNNYENHLIVFKVRGWGTNGSPHHQPLNERFWFYGSGSATCSAWNTSSDDRVKHNERNITNAMNIINKLNAKLYFKSNDIKEHNYNYDLDNSGNPITDEYYRLEAGFIAQEVREIPELKYCVEGKEYVDDFENCFKKDASGNNILDENNEPVLIPEHLGSIPQKLSLSYTDIFVYNVVATQELDNRVNILESENAELKTKNTELENKVATLESELAAIKQHLGI